MVGSRLQVEGITNRAPSCEHFSHFDVMVWYPQSVDILVFYIKSNFLRLRCGTIMLQTISKLTFWSNISTILSNWNNWFCSRRLTPLVKGRKIETLTWNIKHIELGKIFWKMLKYFNTFEHHIEENWLVPETQIINEHTEQETISVLWSAPFLLKCFNNFEH